MYKTQVVRRRIKQVFFLKITRHLTILLALSWFWLLAEDRCPLEIGDLGLVSEERTSQALERLWLSSARTERGGSENPPEGATRGATLNRKKNCTHDKNLTVARLWSRLSGDFQTRKLRRTGTGCTPAFNYKNIFLLKLKRGQRVFALKALARIILLKIQPHVRK